MMKFILILFVIFNSCTLFAQQQLRDFTSVLHSLTNGEEVRAVFHYGAFKLVIDSVEEKSPDVIGGLTIQSWEYFPVNTVRNDRGFLSFSTTVLINHPRRGFVWNYVKCKMFEDNSVEINARYLNITTYESVMNETFYGKINNGSNTDGAYFYTSK